MKSIVITIFFLLTNVLFVAGQDEDKTAIRNIVADQVIAWNAGDLDGFMKDVQRSDTSKNFIGLSGGRTIRGWRATLDSLRIFYADSNMAGLLAIDITGLQFHDRCLHLLMPAGR